MFPFFFLMKTSNHDLLIRKFSYNFQLFYVTLILADAHGLFETGTLQSIINICVILLQLEH